MAPAQHLAWFEDNINWFGGLAAESLDRPVPNCPGWTVEDVLNHLSFGLGVGYPIGLGAAPDSAEADVWQNLPRPAQRPTGTAAIETFVEHLGNCLDTFRAVDPDQPCWTYAGPGHARFWFRRAAIETTLHRLDVAGALGIVDQLAEDRLIDAIDETVGFALPLAAAICAMGSSAADGNPATTDDRATTGNPATTVAVAESARVWTVGDGDPVATISGPGTAVLDALWGRNTERVTVTGDEDVAKSWLSMVDTAFAGR